MKENLTVGECFGFYRDEHLQVATASPERADFAWQRLRPHFTKVKLADLTPARITRYSNSRLQRGVSAGTINRELGVLVAALKWAYRSGRIDRVPFVQRLAAPASKKRWLDDDEIAALLSAAASYPHVLAFVQIGLLTGQRQEAILSLTWGQVDFKRGEIDFRDPTAIHAGRRKGRGFVPMSDQLRKILEDLKVDAEGPWVIRYNGFRVTKIYTAWNAIVATAGLKDVTPHVLRHTAATRMINSGIPLIDAARVLGHASSRVTEQIYAHHLPRHLKSAVTSLEL
jgi:integrase